VAVNGVSMMLNQPLALLVVRLSLQAQVCLFREGFQFIEFKRETVREKPLLIFFLLERLGKTKRLDTSV
jgi:uncharacterized membrane protein